MFYRDVGAIQTHICNIRQCIYVLYADVNDAPKRRKCTCGVEEAVGVATVYNKSGCAPP